MRGAARQGPPQRRARRARLPDRRRPGLRRQRRLRPRRPDQRASSRPSTTRPATASRQPGLGVQADPLRGRLRRQAADAGQPAARRHDRVQSRARTGRRATPTSSSAARSSSARRSSTRSTSRPSGPSSASATSRSPTTAEALGLRFTGGRKAFLQAGPGRRARHGRGPAARPDVGLRRARQRRRPRPAADDPRDPTGPTARSSGRRPSPTGTQAISPQAAFLVTRHPGRQHGPEAEPDLGREAGAAQRQGRRAPAGRGQDRAPRTTPATSATYGFLAPPRRTTGPALAVGVWMGNSDHSNPRRQGPGHLADRGRAAVARLRARLHEAAGRSTKFDATERAWSRRRSTPGRAASPGRGPAQRRPTGSSTARSPGARRAIDPDGLLYSRSCGGWRVDLVKAELGPGVAGTTTSPTGCAGPGAGPASAGQYDSRTAYFWEQRSWGGPLVGSCAPPRSQPGRDQRQGQAEGPR